MRFRCALIVAGAVAPVLAASLASASVPSHARKVAADPPSSDSIAATLDIPPVSAAGIPGFAGTWAATNVGPSGGLDVAYLPSSSAMSSYVSIAVGTSTSTGTTPGIPPKWLAQTNITRGAGPSLIPGGPHLVTEYPAIHTHAECDPPHLAMAAAHVTLHVVTISGKEVLPDGPAVTETVTGSQIGLAPKVATAGLTFSLTTATQTTGDSYAHADVILTITGTLYGPGDDELYSGRLATLTWGDVTADCTSGPTTANVTAVKSAPVEAPQGKDVTYTLDVFNDGPGTADDVVVTDQTGDDLTVVSVPPECTLTGKTLTCDLGSMAAGESRRITYTARVGTTAHIDTNIENCETVSSTTPQESENGKVWCTSTTVVPDPANLSIVKSGPARALPGGSVTYDFTVTNHGPDAAGDVEFADVLPAELTGISVPAGCALAGRTLTCSFGTLFAGASHAFTVTATAAPGTADGTAIHNCATVTTSTPETDDADNRSCAQTIVGAGPPPAPSDAGITKTGPVTVEQGGTATYTLRVTNHGTVDAANTVVSDVLPDDVTVIGVPAGCTLAGRTLTCTAGTLPPGASASFTVHVRISADAPAGFDVENCDTVETTTPDSDLTNNGACTAARVQREPVTDLAMDKTGPRIAERGEVITYTLTATNRSGAEAQDTVVGDVFPGEATVTGIPADCALSGLSLTCAIGTLPAGATRTFLVTAEVRSDLVPLSAFENCAAVTTTTTETNLEDNASCRQTIVSTAPPLFPVTG
jgi:uncharacterized repeat protein (TIGR01451 family)